MTSQAAIRFVPRSHDPRARSRHPAEHPKFACRAIDVRATEAGTVEDRRLIAQLVQTLSQDGEGEDDRTAIETLVAYRGMGRWVQTFEPSPVPTASARMPVPRTCLITGGSVESAARSPGTSPRGVCPHRANRAQ